MKRLIFITIFPFFFSDSLSFNFSDSIRAKYIKRFPDYFFLWPVLKQRSTSFDIQLQKDNSQKLSYKPNGNYGMGFGMYVFEIGFEFTLSVQPKASAQFRYGHSRATDLQGNILGKNFGLDLFTQNYNGFYVTDSKKPVPLGIPYPQRPDISIWNTGINGIYFFNKNKYSIRAAYNFSERQIRSGGSFSLAGTLNTYSLRADSAIYGSTYEPVFGVNANFSKLDYTTFSISPGYAYTLVLKKSFFINGSLSIGPANNWLHYQSATKDKIETTINSFIDLRLALGYNSERFFSGVSLIAQSRNIRFEQIQFTSTNTIFKIVFGYRFREFGILKKSARDFLPMLKK